MPRMSVATEASMASFDLAGIKEDVGNFGQCTIAPKLEFGVKFSSEARDLARADFHAAELLPYCGNAAGRNALEMHFGDGFFKMAGEAQLASFITDWRRTRRLATSFVPDLLKF